METSDQLTEKVGSFGLFQKRVLITLNLIALLVSQPVVIVGVFIVYTPPHRCFLPEIDKTGNYTSLQEILPDVPNKFTNSTNTELTIELSHFIPIETGPDGKLTWSQCYRYKNISENDLTKIKCDNGWKYFTEPGLLTAAMEFDLVCDRSWLAPLGTSLIIIGYMIGIIAGGFLADRFGRRWAIFLGCIGIMSCFFLASFFPVWEAILPIWFLVGCFFIVRVVIPVTIINEQFPIKSRYSVNIFFFLASAVGDMLIPLMNYLIKNWRFYLICHAGLQLLVLIPLYLYIKESLTWLLQNKKLKEAEALLQETAKVNHIKYEGKFNLIQIDKNSNQEENCSEEENKNNKKQKLSYIDFLKVSFLRKRVIILAIAWIAVTSSFYGFSINTNNLVGDRYVNALMVMVVEIPSTFLSFAGVKKMGGKKSFILAIGLGGITLLITPLLLNVNETAVTVNNILGKLFASTSFIILYVFTGNYFPTLLRIQGYAASGFASRITSMLVPYLIYAGERYMKELPYLVIGSTGILAMITSCFLPETKNTPLPDTMEDAKKQNKNFKICPTCIFSKKESDST